MNFELTASMMCADYGNLEREVKNLAEGGIDSFHIDIMDGRYVPNFAMSLNDMRYIASVSPKPLDVHLMIEHPNNRIDLFLNNLRQGDTVYIHPEAEYHPSTTLQSIINAGMVPGIAINPGTSVEEGACDVGEPGQCRADVSAVCRQEDHQAAVDEGRYGL